MLVVDAAWPLLGQRAVTRALQGGKREHGLDRDLGRVVDQVEGSDDAITRPEAVVEQQAAARVEAHAAAAPQQLADEGRQGRRRRRPVRCARAVLLSPVVRSPIDNQGPQGRAVAASAAVRRATVRRHGTSACVGLAQAAVDTSCARASSMAASSASGSSLPMVKVLSSVMWSLTALRPQTL